jgi:hypothetical protein
MRGTIFVCRMDFRKTSISLLIPLLIAIFLALPTPAAALGSVDQSNVTTATGWNWINFHQPIGQSFTPTKNSLLGVDVGIDNVLVIDQHYNPGFGSPGVGWNWINFHTPIGQSFTPTMPILGGVNVGVFNDFILDQSNAPGFGDPGVGWNWVQAHQPIGQSFKPTYPRLWRVDLGLENPSAGPISLTLNIRQSTIAGPVLGSQVFTVPVTGPAFITVYFPPYPGVTLTPGSTYVLDLVGSGSDTVRWYIQNPGSYAGGTGITSGVPGGEYFFKTYGFGDTITMNIHSGSIGGPTVASRTLPIPPMDFPIMMNFNLTLPITVSPGSPYVIELQQSPRSVRFYLVNPGGYPGGTAITDGTVDASSDYFFETYGAGNALTVNIRSGSIGGPILTTVPVVLSLFTAQLVHVDLPSPVTTTPGNLYVIELQESVQSIRWYEVNPGGGYPGGTAITSGAIDAGGDYIFNTYGPQSTSLSVSFAPPTVDIGTHPAGTGSITATISPAAAGLPVSIYYGSSASGPWTLISTGPTDGSGKYVVTWAPPATGTYYFRADFTGSNTYAASTITSAPNSMVVVPEFPPVAVGLMIVLAIGIFEILHKRSKKQAV